MALYNVPHVTRCTPKGPLTAAVISALVPPVPNNTDSISARTQEATRLSVEEEIDGHLDKGPRIRDHMEVSREHAC